MISASTDVNSPCSSSSPISGRRSTNSNIAAGSVSSAISRTPSDVRSMNAALSWRRTAIAISGSNVVAIDTASSPWGSTKNVNAWKYAAESPEPGPDRLRITIVTIWLHAT